MLTCDLMGEQLLLLPEKAIYWPSRKTLLVADAHLGKIRHFRKSGIAVPGQAGYRNLAQLSVLIQKHKPEQVIFLGDLFHSELNFEWIEFKAFLKTFNTIRFTLILGNHDILHDQSYAQLEVVRESMAIGPFLLSHEPLEEHAGYNLCGHIHPGVRLQGPARESMRLPCFYFGSTQGVLPAFGVFTGLYMMKPTENDRVFVITGNEVLATSHT